MSAVCANTRTCYTRKVNLCAKYTSTRTRNYNSKSMGRKRRKKWKINYYTNTKIQVLYLSKCMQEATKMFGVIIGREGNRGGGKIPTAYHRGGGGGASQFSKIF